jgi:hypothetical protein
MAHVAAAAVSNPAQAAAAAAADAESLRKAVQGNARRSARAFASLDLSSFVPSL